jgi:glyoxylase-like metal-dependent hydrolase (beta-lactamase superfamily II)
MDRAEEPSMPTIHPVVDEGLGNSAYVIELGDGRALVVDPARDPTAYLELARWRRLRIVYAAETHLHADFLTGSRELAAADGAQVLAPRKSRLGFAHRGLEGGEEVDLGGLTLRAVGTPGHAPEHVSYLLLDDGRPQALFSGGALLVGTVARTDLASPDLTEPLAQAAYQSLHQRLLSLPDELGVFPTHGAGSFCSASVGGERTTTIGAERRHNRLLAAPDEDTFVAELLGSLGSYPPYFLRLRDRNRVGPELLDRDWRVLGLLSNDRVRAQLAGGAVLIDARPFTAFAAGHIPGALSIALRPQFASWLGCWSTTPNPWCSSWTRTRIAVSWPASAAPSATTSWRASWPAAWPPGGPSVSRKPSFP